MNEINEIEEFPVGAIALALAPFQLTDIANVTARLICLSGAEEVEIMPRAGRFSVWFATDRRRSRMLEKLRVWCPKIPIVDYRLGKSATFAPYEVIEHPEQYRDRLPLDENDWRVFVEAITITWERMLEDAAAAVERGEYEILARIGSELAPSITKIQITSWSNFLIEDWASGTAVSAQTKTRLVNVHLAPLRYKGNSEDFDLSINKKPQSRAKPAPFAKVAEIISARHKQAADDGRDPPTIPRDLEAVKAKLPTATRKQVEKARGPFGPFRSGRPKKISQQKLPKSRAGEKEN